MKLLQQANTTTSTNTLWTISANLKSNVAKNYDARRCYPFATPYKEQIAVRMGRGGGETPVCIGLALASFILLA